MSAKISSLAYDEALKDLDLDHFEPDLKVFVNSHYLKTPCMTLASDLDVIQVRGRITVSF